jgi:hypothetical protein
MTTATEVIEVPLEWGGSGGKPFASQFVRLGRLRKIHLYHGKYLFWTVVSGIEIEYDFSTQTERFGTCQGDPQISLVLEPEEEIILISGRYGSYLDSLSLTTNEGRTVVCGGTGGKHEFAYRAPVATFINGFHGAAGAGVCVCVCLSLYLPSHSHSHSYSFFHTLASSLSLLHPQLLIVSECICVLHQNNKRNRNLKHLSIFMITKINSIILIQQDKRL